MKVKTFTIAIHSIIWLLFLFIPYISADQIFLTVNSKSNVEYSLMCLALSAVLIATFYFNYFILIPKFLLTKRYWVYSLFLLFTVFVVTFLFIATLVVSDFTPDAPAEQVRAIEKSYLSFSSTLFCCGYYL
jgi:hypothetical protein